MDEAVVAIPAQVEKRVAGVTENVGRDEPGGLRRRADVLTIRNYVPDAEHADLAVQRASNLVIAVEPGADPCGVQRDGGDGARVLDGLLERVVHVELVGVVLGRILR